MKDVLQTRKERERMLGLALLMVFVLGILDGAFYLSSRNPGVKFLKCAALSASHPLVGLALPVIGFGQGGLVNLAIGSVPLVLDALLVLAARAFLLRAKRKALAWVVLTGLASYWLTTRMLFASLYGPAWF